MSSPRCSKMSILNVPAICICFVLEILGANYFKEKRTGINSALIYSVYLHGCMHAESRVKLFGYFFHGEKMLRQVTEWIFNSNIPYEVNKTHIQDDSILNDDETFQ